MAVIFDEKRGPMRVVLEAYGGALALFKTSERNRATKTALISAGEFWVVEFLGKRFSNYAMTALGYRVSEKWRKAKERELGLAVPFMGFTPSNGGNPRTWHEGHNSEKMSDAVRRGTRVDATARAGDTKIVITIPFGHPVQADAAAAFKSIPEWEVQALARELARTLASIIDGAQETTGKKASRTIIGATSSRGLPGGSARSLPGGSPRKVA